VGNQSGGNIAEPIWEQNQPNQPNSPRIDLRTGSITSLEIGSRTGPEPVSSSIPAREKACLLTHLLHDHGNIKVCTPFIRSYLILIQECKPDPNVKTFVLSMLFSLTLGQKDVHEALVDSD